MNCYGYAFCNILNGYATMYGKNGYKQQPGDFARSSDKSKVKPNYVGTDTIKSMENIVWNMKLDASRLGYTITEITPSSSTVEQCGTTSRMIAVVNGVYSYFDGVGIRKSVDYHFYMQHSDGTWSHKPGSGPVSNVSLTSGVKLTNSNIRFLANEDIYAGGEIRFFEITKSAVIDYPHGKVTKDTETELYYKEKAGDTIRTSAIKSTGSTFARIDFAEDQDMYCFNVPYTKKNIIKTTRHSGSSLGCVVLNTNGSVITTQASGEQVNFTISMSAGETYFLLIFNKSKKVTDYVLTVS